MPKTDFLGQNPLKPDWMQYIILYKLGCQLIKNTPSKKTSGLIKQIPSWSCMVQYFSSVLLKLFQRFLFCKVIFRGCSLCWTVICHIETVNNSQFNNRTSQHLKKARWKVTNVNHICQMWGQIWTKVSYSVIYSFYTRVLHKRKESVYAQLELCDGDHWI